MNILWCWQLFIVYLNCSHCCIHELLQYDPLCSELPRKESPGMVTTSNTKAQLAFPFLAPAGNSFCNLITHQPYGFLWLQASVRRELLFQCLLQDWKTPFWVWFILVFRCNWLPELPHLHILSAIWTMPSCFNDSHYPAVKPCQLSLALFQCLCSEVCSISVDFQYNVPK